MDTCTPELARLFRADRHTEPRRQRQWNSLDELRTVAFAAGSTPAQFMEAIETIGTDPRCVANYLQRYALSWRLSASGDHNGHRIS